MEEYRVYSHGRKNVVEVGVGVKRDWQFYEQQGLMIFFDIFALKKLKLFTRITLSLFLKA